MCLNKRGGGGGGGGAFIGFKNQANPLHNRCGTFLTKNNKLQIYFLILINQRIDIWLIGDLVIVMMVKFLVYINNKPKIKGSNFRNRNCFFFFF